MTTAPGQRFALRLLAYADRCGVSEALIGDVLEERARGRSAWWVWQQLVGLYGLALKTQVRDRVRMTPLAVAVALGTALLAGVSMTSMRIVLQAWLGLYFVTGTLSLFGHMAARADGGRRTVTPEAAEASNVR